MKYKTTRKEIARNSVKLYACGYCALQPLTRYLPEAIAYNSGLYGWNFDVYKIGQATICSGYRSMPGKELPEAARRILQNAEKYDRIIHDKRIGTSPAEYSALLQREEKYMKAAAKRFYNVLNNTEKVNA